MALGSASGAGGAVYSDLSALFEDFEYLNQAAFLKDSSRYNEVAAQIDTDSQALWTDCSTG